MSDLQERVEREKETYNSGLKRDSYDSFMSHCTVFTNTVKEQFLIDEMKPFMEGSVLELGCDCWYGWLHNMKLYPKDIHCINISETEVEIGKKNLGNSPIQPTFHVMDAHKLDFEDNSFDLIFGGALLHHLDLPTVMKEMNRVLKDGGKFVFWEPLLLNPIALIVRALTPQYRTKDEQPFGLKEFEKVREVFDVRFIPFEFFVTPAGIISKKLFKKPDNWFMRTAYAIDRALIKICPPIKYLFRAMILVGEKKK